MPAGTPPEDDISPIRQSLPEGPPAPVLPILLEWALLSAAGFTLRVPAMLEDVYRMAQIGGIVAVVLATGIAIYLLRTRSVIARFSGGAGIVMAVAFVVWVLSRKAP